MLLELLRLPLAWIMLGLASFAYFTILIVWLNRHYIAHNQANAGAFFTQAMLLPGVIISALPLIGLLVTVMGLQRSFANLVYVSSQSYAVSAGISFAMLTTLLGLSLAVLGWVLFGWVKSSLVNIEANIPTAHSREQPL
jgi:biopolymer transport protein ExbB